ncbi:hypothetical protein ACFE04_024616 [Oxalis oulophora]
MGMDHGAGKKKHSKTHSDVVGDNDKHFTSSHQENADSSIHDSETYSRSDDSSGSGSRKDSSSDDNDAYPDRFGSREILDTLFPTTELESSSSSSSSSENLFQVDPKKGIKHKPSVPISDEVTRRRHDKSDGSEKESSDSFEFCDDSAMLPTESPPVQTMDRSIYNRSDSMLDWSVTSNDSLFSINVGNHSFSGDQQDVMMRNSEESIRSGELIDYVPSLPVNKKENRERTEGANGGPENEVQNESKAANPKVTWNSSDDSDQSGGNAQCFAFPSIYHLSIAEKISVHRAPILIVAVDSAIVVASLVSRVALPALGHIVASLVAPRAATAGNLAARDCVAAFQNEVGFHAFPVHHFKVAPAHLVEVVFLAHLVEVVFHASLVHLVSRAFLAQSFEVVFHGYLVGDVVFRVANASLVQDVVFQVVNAVLFRNANFLVANAFLVLEFAVKQKGLLSVPDDLFSFFSISNYIQYSLVVVLNLRFSPYSFGRGGSKLLEESAGITLGTSEMFLIHVGRTFLGFHHWLSKNPNFTHSDETLSFFVDYFGRRKDFKVIDDLIIMERDCGFKKDKSSLKVILKEFCVNGYASYVENIVKSFTHVIFSDEGIYDLLVKGWCRYNKLDEARRLAREMYRGGFEIGTTASLYLAARIREGDEMINRMKSAGFRDDLDIKACYGFLKKYDLFMRKWYEINRVDKANVHFKETLDNGISSEPIKYRNRTNLSVPRERKASSVGECSIQRGAPM